MVPRIVEAEYIKSFTLRLKFDDGLEGHVDLKDELWGPVFEPLKSRPPLNWNSHTTVASSATFSPKPNPSRGGSDGRREVGDASD